MNNEMILQIYGAGLPPKEITVNKNRKFELLLKVKTRKYYEIEDR